MIMRTSTSPAARSNSRGTTRPVVAMAMAWCVLALALASATPSYAATDDLPTLDDLLNLSGGGEDAGSGDAGDADDDADSQADADAAATGSQDQNEPDALELDPEIADRLNGQSGQQPLDQAIRLMGNAAQRLVARMDPGVETQRIQTDALAKLDQVIADAQKQRPKSSSSSSSSSGQSQQQQQDTGSQQNQAQQSQQPGSQQQQGQGQEGDQQQASSPSNQSGIEGGAPGSTQAQPDESQMLEYREEWGNLPARLREDLMQGLSERYSSVYEDLTRAYYRRLAQEQE